MKQDTYYSRAKAKREKRRKQVRKNIILLIVSTILLSTVVVFFACTSIQASDSNHPMSYKYFKSVYISSGDTLWSIAQENMDSHYANTKEYIEEVKRMNSLTSNQIMQGSYLMIPYYSTEYIE